MTIPLSQSSTFEAALARITSLEGRATVLEGGSIASSSDVGATINAATAALSLAGGGTLLINTPGNYTFTTPIALLSYVSIVCGEGVWLRWGGANAAGSPLVESSSTDVLRGNASILQIDSQGYQGSVVRLHSAFKNEIRIWHRGYSVVSTVLNLTADSTAGGDGYSKRNIAANDFWLVSEATSGTLIATSGLAVNTYDGTPSVVSLNTFHDVFGHDQFVKGIDFQDWTDNNAFVGFTRVGQSATDNTIGIDFGSTGGSGASVYQNIIEDVAVDTYVGHTGRVGVRFRALTKANIIRTLHQDPPAETPVLIDATCKSYRIGRMIGSTSELVEESRFLSYVSDNFTTSEQFTLADDTIYSINLLRGSETKVTCLVEFTCNDVIGNGLYRLQVGTSPSISAIWRENTTFQAFSSGAAIGSIAGYTDNRITIYADSSGVLSFVNRLGYAVYGSIRTSNVVRY